jgi:tRNA 2-thiouridine synthesizing protein D
MVTLDESQSCRLVSSFLLLPFNVRRSRMANFLFVLSQDDNEKVTRCFQFAKIAHEKGHNVNLFFIDSGVRWADSHRNFSVKTPTGDCPNDYLPYLVDHEIPIGV